MPLSRNKQVVDFVKYEDLREAVEALLSEREGRKVDIRDYADTDSARVKAFEETAKLGDNSWYSTPYAEFTEVQQKQHDIYKKFTADIPYMDFWHWWIDNIDEDVCNDSTSSIYWSDTFSDQVELLNEVIAQRTADGNTGAVRMKQFHLTVLKAFNDVLLTIYSQKELDDSIDIRYSW